jgi:hypothetical protein
MVMDYLELISRCYFVCIFVSSCVLFYYVCIAVLHTLVAGCWLEVSVRKVL